MWWVLVVTFVLICEGCLVSMLLLANYLNSSSSSPASPTPTAPPPPPPAANLFKLKNATLSEFSLNPDKPSLSFHFAYAAVANESLPSNNVSSSFGIEGIEPFRPFFKIHLISSSNKQLLWFADINETVALNLSQVRSLKSLIEKGTLVMYVYIFVYKDAAAATCPVHAVLPGKYTQVFPCY